ncbi:hypothetical protein BDZ91DRAFT_794439 [Kalaharituber pfeilii]|nr:hypothetical protein BDZ91DRAFT_794439 [Kalaharituber pfeilii]
MVQAEVLSAGSLAIPRDKHYVIVGVVGTALFGVCWKIFQYDVTRQAELGTKMGNADVKELKVDINSMIKVIVVRSAMAAIKSLEGNKPTMEIMKQLERSVMTHGKHCDLKKVLPNRSLNFLY